MKVAIFLLRTDTVSGKSEGEVYYPKEGIIHCNWWTSPKLIDHKVIIATGKKHIQAVFNQYPNHHITTSLTEPK